MSSVTLSRQISHPLSSEWVHNLLSSHFECSRIELPLTVAFSGGVDSTVLLHLLAVLRDQGTVSEVRAVHIHHGLSQYADQWATHCQKVCQQCGVPLNVVRVSLENEGFGIEQAARDARYRVFVDSVRGGGCLLQGHHQDDQAETILLRLFRGTGMDGVQGIPESRTLGEGSLFRPLLKVPGLVIAAYANANGLAYIEDDSNNDERFSRNYLRHRLIPMVEERWPGASERLVQFADEVGEMNQRLQVGTKAQLKGCLEYRPQWLLGSQPLLNIKTLQQMESHVQRLVVREWLKKQGWQPPSRNMLEQIFREIINARIDAEPQVKMSEHCVISRFQERLVVLDPVISLEPFEPVLWDWQKVPVLRLGARSLICHQGPAENCRAIYLPKKPLLLKRRCHIPVDEKIAVAGRKGRKTLKKLLQEHKVPPWLRDYLPFIFDGDQMVAAPGLWVCESYCSNTDNGFSLHWRQHLSS